MSELQKAKEWLKYFKQLKEANLRSYPHRTQDAEAVENCKVLLALIDSVLAEPSDADVAEAIEWMEIEKETAQNSWERAGAEWRMEPGAQEMHDEQMAAFDLAITALSQYQKPTDEKISVAIWYQDSHIQREECRWRDVSEEDDCEPGARNFHDQYIEAHKLAIQALRQMDSTKHSTDSTRATDKAGDTHDRA